MNIIEKALARISQWLSWLASLALAGMMFLVALNVVLRAIYKPMIGVYELVGFLSALTISFGLAHTTVKQGHVAVDLFVSWFPKSAQRSIEAFSNSLSVFLFAMISWQSAKYALELASTGQLSETLRIPYYPLVYGLSIACGLTCLVLALEAVRSIKN
ncbi:MAG: TRAP transporter small permease [Pseudomonadota bacterium]